jgi:hypothetical protein
VPAAAVVIQVRVLCVCVSGRLGVVIMIARFSSLSPLSPLSLSLVLSATLSLPALLRRPPSAPALSPKNVQHRHTTRAILTLSKTTTKILFDAGAAYSIFTSSLFFDAGPDFSGRGVLTAVLDVR